jgi:hypothetical protein
MPVSAASSLRLSSLAAVVAAVLLAPVGIIAPVPALAQSGSRLCGWTSEGPAKGQATALLLEVRTGDDDYHRQCSDFIESAQKKIAADGALSRLQWRKVERAACDSVGQAFRSTAQPDEDMCAYMWSKTPYKVQRSMLADKTTATTYDKL